MTVDQKILFLPGGPGLSSFPDKVILDKKWREHSFISTFWNEPSSQRPEDGKFSIENSFDRWLESAGNCLRGLGGPVIVVGSSFGALGLEYLWPTHQQFIKKVVLVAPVFNLDLIHHRMIDIALNDFQRSGDPLYKDLMEIKTRGHRFYDLSQEAAMGIVFQAPQLFGHYWHNKIALEQWTQGLQLPGHGVDFISQKWVLKDLAKHHLPKHKMNCPVRVVLGIHDPVNRKDEVVEYYQQKTSDFKLYEFKKSAHFPHLEEPDLFIDVLKA